MRSTFARTTDAMKASPLLQISAIGAITATTVIVGLAAVAALNATRLTAHWGQGSHVVVQLRDDIAAAEVDRLRTVLAARPEVSDIRLVTQREALHRLQRALGSQSGLLDDLTPDLLPASLEIRLTSSPHTELQALLALLGSLPEVEHVDHLGSWAERIDALAGLARGSLLLLALLVTVAGIYIVASATRIGMLSRAEEIRIQRLLGGTDRFVNAPLMIEGLIQGCVAVGLALALLYAMFAFAAPQIDDTLALLASGARLQFFGPGQIGIALCAGGTIGLVGSRLAIGQSARVH